MPLGMIPNNQRDYIVCRCHSSSKWWREIKSAEKEPFLLHQPMCEENRKPLPLVLDVHRCVSLTSLEKVVIFTLHVFAFQILTSKHFPVSASSSAVSSTCMECHNFASIGEFSFLLHRTAQLISRAVRGI